MALILLNPYMMSILDKLFPAKTRDSKLISLLFQNARLFIVLQT